MGYAGATLVEEVLRTNVVVVDFAVLVGIRVDTGLECTDIVFGIYWEWGFIDNISETVISLVSLDELIVDPDAGYVLAALLSRALVTDKDAAGRSPNRVRQGGEIKTNAPVRQQLNKDLESGMPGTQS